MVLIDGSSHSPSFVAERILWLEAMAKEYDQLIPHIQTQSRRRRWQLRANACRFQVERLRQSAADSKATEN